MKRIIILAGLMACTVSASLAQNTQQGTTTRPQTQGQDSRGTTYPYMGQGKYNTVNTNRVPQNIQSSFGTNYEGVNGANWEYNNEVYRSSFMQNGKNMSVLYGQDGRVIETRTGTTMNELPSSLQDALNGKNATAPYEIRVGDNTYYSTQQGGKEVYYDSNGSPVKIPQTRKP
jgi:hypothetical protein